MSPEVHVISSTTPLAGDVYRYIQNVEAGMKTTRSIYDSEIDTIICFYCCFSFVMSYYILLCVRVWNEANESYLLEKNPALNVTRMHARTHACTHARAHTHAHARTHVRAHAHAHTHTHTHTHTHHTHTPHAHTTRTHSRTHLFVSCYFPDGHVHQ